MTGGRSNPQRGAAFERTVAARMTEAGWVVFRVAGSRGPADLIALRLGAVALVQCKIDGRLSSDAWNALRELALAHGATAVLAQRGTVRGTVDMIEIANARTAHRPFPRDKWDDR